MRFQRQQPQSMVINLISGALNVNHLTFERDYVCFFPEQDFFLHRIETQILVLVIIWV